MTSDTIAHIRRVQLLLHGAIANLLTRGRVHDSSKLTSPECEIFSEYEPRLRNITYGSDEYRQCLAEMKPALDHHYAHNRHHPEYWPAGMRDMTLLDLLEMLCDWKAASERHADGNLVESIEKNQSRFGYDNEMKARLLRTASELWPEHLQPWHCCGCGNGGAIHNFCEQCGAGKNDYRAR